MHFSSFQLHCMHKIYGIAQPEPLFILPSLCTHLALVHAVIPALHKLYLQRPHVGAGRVQYREAFVVRIELSAR